MTFLALTFVISCVASLILTPCIRQLCRRKGLVDRPDGHRKLHGEETALAGGLTAYSVTLAVLAGLGTLTLTGRMALSGSFADLCGLFAAATAILLVGLIDDARTLRGRQKLVGQIISCLCVIASGVVIARVSIFGWSIELGLLSVPFTLLFLLATINAVNLLDGINGLAASIGVINCSALAVMAYLGHRDGHALVAAAFAGSLLGFLRYNFPRASVFLGDGGSMLIGLLLGVISIQTSLKGPGTVLLVAPICLLTIPLFDSAAAIVRRKLTGRSIFSTDRAHLHHRLKDRVGGVGATSIVAMGSLVTASAAVASVNWLNESVAVVCAAALVIMFVASRIFGYAELRLLAKKVHSLGRSLIELRSQTPNMPMQHSIHLQGDREWQLLWSALTEYAEQNPIERIEMDVNAPSLQEGFHAAWNRRSNLGDEKIWRFDAPLMVASHRVGHIRVAGQRNSDSAAQDLEKFLELVESFEDRLRGLVGGPEAVNETQPSMSDTDLEIHALSKTAPEISALNS